MLYDKCINSPPPDHPSCISRLAGYKRSPVSLFSFWHPLERRKKVTLLTGSSSASHYYQKFLFNLLTADPEIPNLLFRLPFFRFQVSSLTISNSIFLAFRHHTFYHLQLVHRLFSHSSDFNRSTLRSDFNTGLPYTSWIILRKTITFTHTTLNLTPVINVYRLPVLDKLSTFNFLYLRIIKYLLLYLPHQLQSNAINNFATSNFLYLVLTCKLFSYFRCQTSFS